MVPELSPALCDLGVGPLRLPEASACRVPATQVSMTQVLQGPFLPRAAEEAGLEKRRIWVWISVLQLVASAALAPFSKLRV